jgi:outer membrane lipoprotein-sorting protein
MWISKQSGLAVKLVSGTTTMEYSNYKFDAIADSMFQLPSDAMMITMPGM